MRKKLFEKIKAAAVSSLNFPGKKVTLPKSKQANTFLIFVFRHTQTYDNRRKIFSGRRESSLTKKGIRQAKKLAQLLKNKKIDLFISSPLSRCLQTLKEVRKFHPNVPLIKEPLLMERDYGSLTGKSKLKLMRENLEKAVLYRRSYDISPPDGESLKTVKIKRVFPFCRKLVSLVRRKQINIAVCCTNNTMRLIRMFFENLSVEEMLTLENPFGDFASYSVFAS